MEAGAAAEAATQSGGGDPHGAGSMTKTPSKVLKRRCNNKAYNFVINLMYDLLACQHDHGITEVMPTKGDLKDVEWMEVDCLEHFA